MRPMSEVRGGEFGYGAEANHRFSAPPPPSSYGAAYGGYGASEGPRRASWDPNVMSMVYGTAPIMGGENGSSQDRLAGTLPFFLSAPIQKFADVALTN